MGIWYYYVNKTKKEYFTSGDMGYGLKEWAYKQSLLPLIGYLHCNYDYVNSGPCNGHEREDNEDFPLKGHWMKDDCGLVNDYSEEWESIEGYSWSGTDDKSDKKDPRWVNISKQLFEEYNDWIKYWNQDYEGDSEETKEQNRRDIEKLSVPIGPLGPKFE